MSSTPEGDDHQGLALAVISMSQLMVVLDVTIVNVALPSINRALHFSAGNLVWVTTAYSLTFGGLLLFGGRTGDLFGRRRMFMAGIAIFAGASLLGGLATDSTWLILARALQGVGGAIASPTALSLIATNFAEGPPRNRAMGIYAAMSGAGAAIGLLAGGVLTDLVSWRWVLFVNVPIGALALLIAPRVLRESETTRGRLDLPGAVSVTAGMALLVYALTNAATHSWSSTGTVGALDAAALLLVAFAAIEIRSPHALMPLRIFANRDRSGGYLIMLCMGASVFAIFFFVTLYFQGVRGYSPLRAGFAFLPVALIIGLTAQGISQLIARVGTRLPLLVGPAVAAVGLGWMSTISPSTSYLGVLGPLAAIGIGMGTAFVPLTLTAVAGVEPGLAGLASALLNTGQQIGGAVGLAVLSTIAVTATRTRLHALGVAHHGALDAHLRAEGITHGYSRAFLVGAGIALVATAVSAASIRVRRSAAADVSELASVPA